MSLIHSFNQSGPGASVPGVRHEVRMEVTVNRNIEAAIRILRRSVEREGIFKLLKRRDLCPNLTDRKKLKMLVSVSRAKRKERRVNAILEGREHGWNR